MAYTVDDVIDMAVERSNLNDESLFSTTELYRFVSSFEQRAFMLAANLNADFYGREGTSTRVSNTAAWNLKSSPSNVGKISRVQISGLTGTPTGLAVGDEIEVVNINDPEFGIAPRAYFRNGILYEYNSELSDDGSNYVDDVKVYYAYVPPRRTTGAATLDIDEMFIDMVVLPLSRLMALRDQRADEIPLIDQEYQNAYITFAATVTGFDEVALKELDIMIPPQAGGGAE